MVTSIASRSILAGKVVKERYPFRRGNAVVNTVPHNDEPFGGRDINVLAFVAFRSIVIAAVVAVKAPPHISRAIVLRLKRHLADIIHTSG
jgi:hypothetical protein